MELLKKLTEIREYMANIPIELEKIKKEID